MMTIFHSPFPRKKLPIRPMLMRGRAQAFCFDESARGSRRSGMSVSSRKSRYGLIATRMSSRSSSGVFMEFSARQRGEIHEGSVPFFPRFHGLCTAGIGKAFARPFRLSDDIV